MGLPVRGMVRLLTMQLLMGLPVSPMVRQLPWRSAAADGAAGHHGEAHWQPHHGAAGEGNQ